MVPINDTELIIDYIKRLDLEVILVSRNYLGSINHTILSIDVLRQRGCRIRGIVFNGLENMDTESFIEKHSGLPVILRIGEEAKIDQNMVMKYAKEVNL